MNAQNPRTVETNFQRLDSPHFVTRPSARSQPVPAASQPAGADRSDQPSPQDAGYCGLGDRVLSDRVLGDGELGDPDRSGPVSLGSSRLTDSSRSGESLASEGLQLHGQELIDRLQSWSETLDSREAELNAREARFEVRQRQARLQRQQWADELAEQEKRLDRLRRQIESHARRLAFDLS